MNEISIQNIVNEQRKYFLSGKTLPLKFRLETLDKLENLIKQNIDKLNEAFILDFNKHPFDVLSTEVYLVLEEIKYFKKHLKKLMKPKRVKTSIINFPSKGYLIYEPYGVCLIMAPWNYPFQLTFEPLIGAIASGNTVILKPASYTKNVSKVIEEIINNFPSSYIACVTGGREENQALLKQKFDYIFFTGGETVGKLVLEKASKYLTPVTLELGGKSPCIVDKSVDIEIAARRIAWGKFLNAGQTCVAIDHVYVHEDVHDLLLERINYYIDKFYYINDKLSDEFPSLINEKHKDKVSSFLDDSKIIRGGKFVSPLRLEPTIMDYITKDDKIMQEEIFGPILPILTYSDLDALISYQKTLDKPLALYCFSKDKKVIKKIISNLSFGGGCINDTIMHLTNTYLPFGGVGASGMGSYHGPASFKTFSHQKSILVKSKYELKMKYPPHKEKTYKFLKRMCKIK